MDLNLLKINPNNPQKYKDLSRLKNSISEFPKMFNLRPMVYDPLTKEVLGGNKRLICLREMGFKEIPDGWARPADELTQEEKQRFIIADNVGFGEWDLEKLSEGWDPTDLEDWGVTGLDFGPESPVEGLTDEDSVPQVEETRAKMGDVWLLGEHRLMCGDSTSEDSVRELMDGRMADMVFTDPPYNVGYKGTAKRTEGGIMNDDMEGGAFQQFLSEVFLSLEKVVKKSAGIYVFHASSSQAQFEEALNLAGIRVKNQLIWNKPSLSIGWGDYQWKHEPFFYAGFEGHSTAFYGDRKNTTVLDLYATEAEIVSLAKRIKAMETEGTTSIWSMSRERTGEYVHPTQKPVELISRTLGNSSQQGDIVCDLFIGSGATIIACEKDRRKCYGMELDPHFCDVAIQRWEDFTGDRAIKQERDELY